MNKMEAAYLRLRKIVVERVSQVLEWTQHMRDQVICTPGAKFKCIFDDDILISYRLFCRFTMPLLLGCLPNCT